VVVCLITTLQQIFHRMQQWKNFENRSIFGKDMYKILWLTFLGPPCIKSTFYLLINYLHILHTADYYATSERYLDSNTQQKWHVKITWKLKWNWNIYIQYTLVQITTSPLYIKNYMHNLCIKFRRKMPKKLH